MKILAPAQKAPELIFVEPLEDRIAPASATFIDVDGDIVNVTTSKGTNTQLAALVESAVGDHTMANQMQTLDLTDPVFKGSSVKIIVGTKVATGNGLVNVWNINAAGNDLSSIEVGGDLAKVTAGDSNHKTNSVGTIKVQSIGVNGGAADKDWHLLGGTSSFTVAGDVNGALLEWKNTHAGEAITVGKIAIGGSLIGGTSNHGFISVIGGDDSMGTAGLAQITSVTIGGGLIATNFTQSAAIIAGDYTMVDHTLGKIGKVDIGGNVQGSGANNSGTILALNGGMGDVHVGGSLKGSGGQYGGVIGAYQSGIGAVTIDGSLIGGSGLYSGGINADFNIKSASIGGDVTGSNGGFSGSVYARFGTLGNVDVEGDVNGGSTIYAGTIFGRDGLGNVSIGGNLVGGGATDTGIVGTTNAKIGDVFIGGNLLGGSSAGAGAISGGTGALGKITIDGSVIGGTQGATGRIGGSSAVSIFIGHDLEGTASASAGSIFITGNAGNITVGHSIQGGSTNGGYIKVSGTAGIITIGHDVTGSTGTKSGTIEVIGKTTAVKIGGSLNGGNNTDAGSLILGDVGSITIGKDITGAAVNTGLVNSTGTLSGKMIVGGNVLGGSNNQNYGGGIIFAKAMSIEIKGNLDGGTIANANIHNKGFVQVSGLLSSITIGGNIIAGNAAFVTDYNLGSVRAGQIGTMLVKGNIVGNNTQYATITGYGNTLTTAMAIKNLTVNGTVSYANILAGYDQIGTTLNGDGGTAGGSAQIGTVTVLGDFTNSSIVAGASNANAAKNHWGEMTNMLLTTPADSTLTASIAKIVIKGAVDASVQNGLVAQLLKSVSIGGFIVPVPTGSQHITFSPSANLFITQIPFA